MGSYSKPKKRVHRDFVYLNHDTILNSLSAFEAGKVDEIIERTTHAREGGVEGGVKAGPVKAGGKKKKEESVQEDLVRTRTWFSGFESWHQHLVKEDALGRFDGWDEHVRGELSVGDTVEFLAEVRLSPLHKIFATFTSFASELGKPGSVFQQGSQDVKRGEVKKAARMMEGWMGGKGSRNLAVYILPEGIADSPRIVGRLDDQYIIGGLESVEGVFTVIGQVDAVLGQSDKVSTVRILRDVPPTPMEIDTINQFLKNFAEPAKGLGLEVTEDDLMFSYPTVLLRPIAIFK